MAGTIKTGIKSYYSEKGVGAPEPALTDLGIGPGDLEGKYFKYSEGSFAWSSSYLGSPNPILDYTITITSTYVVTPPILYLTENGFSDTP